MAGPQKKSGNTGKTKRGKASEKAVEFTPEGDVAARNHRKKSTALVPASPKKKAPVKTASAKEADQKKTTAKRKKNEEEPRIPPIVLPETVNENVKGSEGGRKKSSLPETGTGDAVSDKVKVGISLPEEVKKAFFRRLRFFGAAFCILLAALAVFLLRPTPYTERAHSVLLIEATENETTVLSDGRVRATLAGKPTGAVSYDKNGRTAAFVVGDTLYLARGRKVVPVSTDVTDFALCAKGGAVVYRVGASLYRAEWKGKEPSLISPSVPTAEYCVSPDGNEVFFVYEKTDGARQADIYSLSNSKPYLEKTTDIMPVAIADRCRHIYYQADGALYVVSKKKDAPLCISQNADLGRLIFNADFSQALVQTDGEAHLFAGEDVILFTSTGAGDGFSYLSNERVAVRVLAVGRQYMQKTFLGGYYLQYRGGETFLQFLDRKGQVREISSVNENEVYVTDKSVFFTMTESDGRTLLYRVRTGKTEAEMLFEIGTYCPNTDGTRVLYTNVHGGLFSYRTGKNSVQIADNIDAGTLCVTADDVFYYTRGGVLYASENGATPREAAKGVSALLVDTHTLYYLVDQSDGTQALYTNYRNKAKSLFAVKYPAKGEEN